jgi:DNA-binding NtrC family response regulator
MTTPPTSVLYLGCPAPERADAEKLLAAADVSIVWADNAPFVLTELERHNMPVLLDLSRGAAALQIAREIRTRRAATVMFAVTDVRRPDLTTEAVLAGVADVFARPLGGRRVANAIARELKYEAHDSGLAPLENDNGLCGHSPAMRGVMALISRAAGMRAGVLLSGEQGTGRQVAARTIHTLQRAGDGAFVSVDCSAGDGESLAAALFGPPGRSPHGDALRGLEQVSRRGRLYAARGGTIYLQHVAEAPTRVQARLARLLRDCEAVVTETGKAVAFDVRPMAGVDPGFDSAVRDGRVRDDLFRRLSMIRIDMPPLRSRREDIPALVKYFLREIGASAGVPARTLSRSALALVAALPWRGNVAELRRLLESVVAGIEGRPGIAVEDLLAHVHLDGSAGLLSGGGTLKEARLRFEKDYIGAVLEQHAGAITGAARTLGIQRTNLHRKIRALKIGR